MKNKSKVLLIGLSVVVLATLIIVLSAVGSVKLGIGDIFSTLIKGDNKMVSTIVFQMRLPRNILAVLVGANLAISGCLLQSVMKNPLADPGITGVSSGASLFAIIVLLLLPQYTGMLPLIAFVGGAIACVLVYSMAWKNGLKVN